MAEAEAYSPSRYSFMMVFQCTTEEEVAKAIEKVMFPVVGLCLDGINVTMMRVPDQEESS